MQDAYQFAYDVALYYSKRYLPEMMWQDGACDFRLHLRVKATSDEELLRWFQVSPAFINRSAQNFVVDRLRKLYRHQEISTFCQQNGAGEPMEWDFRDDRFAPGEILNHLALRIQYSRWPF